MENLLYSLGVSLEQFKGENGFQHLLQKSKLSLLSFVGEFDRTRDVIFEKRSQSVEKTRKYVLQLDQEFSDVTQTIDKLSNQVTNIFKIMRKFHQYCDSEIEIRNDSAPDSAPSDFSRYFNEIEALNASLRGAARDFLSTGETVKRLNQGAINQIELLHTAAKKSVALKQTELDTLRRKVQVKQAELSKYSPYHGEYANCERELNIASADLEVVGDLYLRELRNAMESTQYALEQTAMAGWSSCNVFLTQLAIFLRDSSSDTQKLSVQYNNIKNEQGVSKAITREKRGAAALSQHQQQSFAQPQNVEDLFSPSPATQNAPVNQEIWLREPCLSDDEAVKLLLPEDSDISDVLLKAPELLRVSNFKPSELQVLYGNRVLSNRLPIKNVFEGESVGTLVVQPRKNVDFPPLPAATVEKAAVSPSKSQAPTSSRYRRRSSSRPLDGPSRGSSARVCREGSVNSHLTSSRNSITGSPAAAATRQKSPITFSNPSSRCTTPTPVSRESSPAAKKQCTTFKQQWGNPLCAICKRSRQAHKYNKM